MVERRPIRRIWCEFLPPETLGDRSTIDLLERFELQPLVALPPSRQSRKMADALSELSRRNLPVGLWPLLSDEDGYWPSEANASQFANRVSETLDFAACAKVAVKTVAIDLEPPLEVTRVLMTGDVRKLATIVYRGLSEAKTQERREARRNARAKFSEVTQLLRTKGIESLAAIVPPIVLDFASGTGLWERALRTPATDIGWSRLSPMMYTSALAPLLPTGSVRSARTLLFESGRAMTRSIGKERSSLSLGCVGSGKLGDEGTFEDPGALALDVAAARAAGVEDLALFALDGVLQRGSPEAWLRPFVGSAPLAPRGIRSILVKMAARSATVGTALFGKRRQV